ncbi:hypothetical protein ColLi_02898 [Colletotrichum liriopes]|uniref:Uncharacterized protein n=1 Tax=Colletotrichum liriopes TaxID=708192 RepID=A0AA37GFP8_9PEZI|nr:hypothetical protein ColLi_02898 [Colletotrichum liriopes]
MQVHAEQVDRLQDAAARSPVVSSETQCANPDWGPGEQQAGPDWEPVEPQTAASDEASFQLKQTVHIGPWPSYSKPPCTPTVTLDPSTPPTQY